MDKVKCFNISIIDTLESNRTLVFEDTAVESPHLIYNGQSDKFANLNTSELHFNLLVKSSDEAVFFHLFTGSEVRFKVVLEDVTDPQAAVIKWQGFLLPEQFSEPLKHSNYFVQFIATDGIGKLKNDVLSANYYQDNKSVLEVINKCLLQTGLVLPIYFAPAIQNAGFILDYLQLQIQTICYLDDGDKKSTYDILVAVLESIGCKLFQYEQQWVIVGLNRINDSEINFSKYNVTSLLELVYLEDEVLTRKIIDRVFYATPMITVLPPLKKMVATWAADNVNNLIPEDAIGHLPVNVANDVNDRTLKYWQKIGDKNFVFNVWWLLDSEFNYTGFEFDKYYNGYKATPSVNLEDDVAGPFIFINNTSETIVLSDLDTNFIDFKEPFYVKGSLDLERFATLKIEFIMFAASGVTQSELQAAIKDEVLENHFFFAITRKPLKNDARSLEEIVFSNFDSDAQPDGIYDFQLTATSSSVKGSLTIDKMLLEESGYYNLRLYPAVSNPLFSGVQVFNKCTFVIDLADDVVVTNERNIGFTTAHEIDVFHSAMEMQTSVRSFVFSEEVQQQMDADILTPLEIEVLPTFFTNNAVDVNGSLWYTKIVVGLSDEDFLNIENGYQLYIKKGGVGVLQLVDPITFTVKDEASEGGKVIVQLKFEPASNGYLEIEASDVLYLKIASGVLESINYVNYWIDKWQRLGVSESVSYLEALNRIYLGCLDSYSFKIEGTYTSLLTPFDLVNFNYKGDRRYTPVVIDNNLTQGISECVLVESKYEDVVVDVVSDLNIPIDISDQVLVPSIDISVTVVSPSLFNYLWSLSVQYSFTDISPVNTLVVAKQLTGSGGVYTGFEKTASVVNISGIVFLTFPIVPGDQAGFYEVSIAQDGIISNTVEVEVAPAVVVPSERVEIATIYTGDVFNLTGTYSINYVGLSPVVVTEYVQLFDINTQVAIGAPVATVIDSNLAQRVVSFSASGSYRIYLDADGIVSNEVAWLSIQI